MPRKKPFTAPIWLLVLIIGTQVLLLRYMLSVQTTHSYFYAQNNRMYYFSNGTDR
jgi:hypothetical protein